MLRMTTEDSIYFFLSNVWADHLLNYLGFWIELGSGIVCEVEIFTASKHEKVNSTMLLTHLVESELFHRPNVSLTVKLKSCATHGVFSQVLTSIIFLSGVPWADAQSQRARLWVDNSLRSASGAG